MKLVSYLMVAMAGVLLFAGTADAARRAHVVDMTGIAVGKSDGAPPTLEETRRLIVAGATKLRWIVKEEAPGTLRLQLNHASSGATVVIDVPYRAGSFDLRYVSSEGLKYQADGTKRTIHASYRRWIDNLIGSITGMD